jgi:hypothetical protein
MGCGCNSSSSKPSSSFSSSLLGGKKRKSNRKSNRKSKTKMNRSKRKHQNWSKKYKKKMRGGSNFIGYSINNPTTDVVNYSSKLLGFQLTNPYITNAPANQSFGYGNFYKV